jgi:hypothetical protein
MNLEIGANSTHRNARHKALSLLPCPEHHIRSLRVTQSTNANIARNPFPFLKLDIISHDDMGNQCLDFIDRKE